MTVEALLDSGTTGLVMSSEFAKKTGVETEKNRKTYICEEYRWLLQQQGGIYWVYGKSEYLLPET